MGQERMFMNQALEMNTHDKIIRENEQQVHFAALLANIWNSQPLSQVTSRIFDFHYDFYFYAKKW